MASRPQRRRSSTHHGHHHEEEHSPATTSTTTTPARPTRSSASFAHPVPAPGSSCEECGQLIGKDNFCHEPTCPNSPNYKPVLSRKHSASASTSSGASHSGHHHQQSHPQRHPRNYEDDDEDIDMDENVTFVVDTTVPAAAMEIMPTGSPTAVPSDKTSHSSGTRIKISRKHESEEEDDDDSHTNHHQRPVNDRVKRIKLEHGQSSAHSTRRGGAKTQATTTNKPAVPLLVPPINMKDPSVIRLHQAFTEPDAFKQRFKKNWSTLRQLVPEVQASMQTRHQSKKQMAVQSKAAPHTVVLKKEVSIESKMDMPTPSPSPSPLPQPSPSAELLAPSASPLPTDMTIGISAIIQPGSSKLNAMEDVLSQPPPVLKRDLSHLPTSVGRMLQAQHQQQVARRKKRRPNLDPLAAVRPSSCPPILEHTQNEVGPRKEAWPQWLQEIANPPVKTKEEQAKDDEPLVKDSATPVPPPAPYQDMNEELPIFPHKPDALLTPIKLEMPLTRPPMQRSATAHPIGWLSASAPSTPANVGLMREQLLTNAFLPPRPPMQSPNVNLPTTTVDGFAVPALPPLSGRGLSSLISPRTSSSIAIGSRPTPLLLPSTSTTSVTAMSPIVRAAASPRLTDATPMFGDSTLLTSIPSTSIPTPIIEGAAVAAAAAGQQVSLARGFSMLSPAIRARDPVVQPPSTTVAASMLLPMSPLVRSNTGAAQVIGGTLQEWCILSANYVESHLRPPKLEELANATRQPRQVLAAALDKFVPPKQNQQLPVAMEVDTTVLQTTGVLQPRTPSMVGLNRSITPMNLNSTPLVRGLSDPSEPPRTVTPTNIPTPFSPNMSRMSSWLHHPHTPSATMSMTTSIMTPSKQQSISQAVPMSPLGLAQPSFTDLTSVPPPSLSRQPTVSNDVAATVPGVPHTVSRVGANYQAEIPPMLTQKQREWERSAYLHAHAAVHGFPRHLPPLPEAPPAAAAAASSHPYLPVPREPKPPFALPSFPASASLALTSRRSHLREKLMGGRKAARRKAQKQEMEQKQKQLNALGSLPGRRGKEKPIVPSYEPPPSLSGYVPPKYPLTKDPPPNFNPQDIWPWSWEEYRERELANEKRQIQILREVRRRTRDERREGGTDGATSGRGTPALPTAAAAANEGKTKFFSSHPSFATFASLFPADSPFAKVHFDDDTLSPYFVCASYERPPSPIQNPRVRSFSPVHVLSVPPTPAMVAGQPPKLTRFPSSLLEPTEFSRRIAALSKGDFMDEEVLYGDEEEEAEEQGRKKLEKQLRASGRAGTVLSRNQREADEDEDVDMEERKQSSTPQPHRSARTVKPAPRHVPHPSASPPNVPTSGGARRQRDGAVGSGGGGSGVIGGRHRRWKFVNGKRLVWWINDKGVVIEGNPPPQDSDSESSENGNSDSDSSDGDSHHSDDSDSNQSDESSIADSRIKIKRSTLPSSYAQPSTRRSGLHSSANPDPLPSNAATLSLAKRYVNMSDLSPSVRIGAARSGVSKILDTLHAGEIHPIEAGESFEEKMRKLLKTFRDYDEKTGEQHEYYSKYIKW